MGSRISKNREAKQPAPTPLAQHQGYQQLKPHTKTVPLQSSPPVAPSLSSQLAQQNQPDLPELQVEPKEGGSILSRSSPPPAPKEERAVVRLQAVVVGQKGPKDESLPPLQIYRDRVEADKHQLANSSGGQSPSVEQFKSAWLIEEFKSSLAIEHPEARQFEGNPGRYLLWQCSYLCFDCSRTLERVGKDRNCGGCQGNGVEVEVAPSDSPFFCNLCWLAKGHRIALCRLCEGKGSM